MFQSRLGFSGRLDAISNLSLVGIDLFQSRLGFSGRLDGTKGHESLEAGWSFNPVLGFLVVSTH